MSTRRRLIGKVKSDKMTKTVVVEVTRTFRHPLYEKIVHSSKTIKAHDELESKVGDEVQVIESHPISREIRWVVEKIIKRAVTPAETLEEEKVLSDDSA
jgi:small subunit ribosomal protein S17